MKTPFYRRLLRSALFSFILIATFGLTIRCSDQCQSASTFVYYEPVYSTTAQLKAAVDYQDPKPIEDLGKIYFKDNFLFINEFGKGIHVIDNRNPKSPEPIGFLNIPGNYDLSIIGNSLYADSFIDLVVFDVSNLQDIREVKRIEGLFDHHQSLGFYTDPEKGIVTDWKMVETVSIQNECYNRYMPWGGMYYRDGVAFQSQAAFSSKAAIAPTLTTGVGGSMARFTISQGHLYALDGSFLDVVDVQQPFAPSAVKEMNISWDVETLFPYGNNLFMGSRTGMYIYNLDNPQQPVFKSHFQHVLSCDPVVVENDLAYITLRGGNACGAMQSQLQVVDIKDTKLPKLLKSYPMVNPYGLGIDNGTLFICDGTDGLKIYDATDVNKISDKLLAHYKNINAFDIIPHQKVAMMIGSDGLFQYDYSDLKNITLLSKLSIAKP